MPSTEKEKVSSSKMKKLIDVLDNSDDAEIIISSGGCTSCPVNVMVGTPMKLLELGKGPGLELRTTITRTGVTH